jgi:hypothetical protein
MDLTAITVKKLLKHIKDLIFHTLIVEYLNKSAPALSYGKYETN